MRENGNPEHRKRIRKFLIGDRPNRTLVRALLAAALAYLVFGHLFRPVIVRGRSMEPTIRDGTFRVANLWAFRRRAPERGDIVVVRMAGPRMYLLKRVLAVPEDRIRFSGGRFWLNGEEQDEPYVVHRGNWSSGEYVLRADEYYVAGDNRESPIEEHANGIATRSAIMGGLLF